MSLAGTDPNALALATAQLWASRKPGPATIFYNKPPAHLLCPVCADAASDPVIFPCSHSCCRRCAVGKTHPRPASPPCLPLASCGAHYPRPISPLPQAGPPPLPASPRPRRPRPPPRGAAPRPRPPPRAPTQQPSRPRPAPSPSAPPAADCSQSRTLATTCRKPTTRPSCASCAATAPRRGRMGQRTCC